MRSRQQDQGGTVTFGANIVDAASGAGVAQPGAIGFTFTRTSAGSYTVNFDPRLVPLHVEAVGQAGQAPTSTPYGMGSPGTFSVATLNTAGAFTNSNWRFTATARDMRT